MGWTSYSYTKTTHLEFTIKQAIEFAANEFNTYGYEVKKCSLHKAKNFQEHNELYLVMTHPEGYKFLMVVLVDIIDSEIYYKEIPISMGPCYYNCPPRFITDLPEPVNEYEATWRRKVLKQC